MILIINTFLHDKNKIGLINIFEHLKLSYKFGNLSDINNYDIIYSPSEPINTSLYPNKKFIFGPHFSVFPDNKLLQINNIHKNSVYIQPSDWVVKLWITNNVHNYLPIKVFSFPVDTNKFSPNYTEKKEITNIFIYYKTRTPKELTYLKSFLNYKNISYTIFDYGKKYKENEYINTLKISKYGIWLGRHESQGFALEEALSCNVPLLVWDVKSMNQEYGYNYADISATVIPYWDERCGEYFYNHIELEKTFDLFISKLETYKPREYILENLSVKKCSERFLELIR
jgi:hypothetical protein